MRKMGDILLDRGLIKKEELEIALMAQKNSDKYLGQILIEMNIITEDILTEIQASTLGLKIISTESLKIHPKIIQFIPQTIAIKYRIVPVYIEPNAGKNTLCMVTSEEPPTTVISKMSEKLNVPIKLFLATYSELEDLLVKHYNKTKENIEVNTSKKLTENKSDEIKEDNIPSKTKEFDEDILTGSVIEDDESDNNSGFDDKRTQKMSLPNLNLNDNTASDNSSGKDIEREEDITPKKVPESISLDLFDETPSPSIKIEVENNIPTLNINRGSGKTDTDKDKVDDILPEDIEEVKENKKLNFLEAFKSEDNYVFDQKQEYINVEIGDELEEESEEEIHELDVDDVDLFDDILLDKEKEKPTKEKNDDFPFALDSLSDPKHKIPVKNTNKNDEPEVKTPPPFSSKDKKIPIPEPKPKPKAKPTPKPKAKLKAKSKPKNNDPQNVDKSGFPAPEIKKFKDNSENETNPSITQKISLNEKKATDEWLKNNKNRDIPDLDSIFGDEEAIDPLDNEKINKLILSQKILDIRSKLIDFLKSKNLNKDVFDSFKDFFDNIENNPSNIILISMLELLLIDEKPNINILFDIILKNINNVDSKNK